MTSIVRLFRRWLFGQAPAIAPQTSPPMVLIGLEAAQKEKILEHAIEIRRFEIERFWQRSAFFWTFIGATFVAYGAIYPKSPRLLMLISAFGGLASLIWTLQNRGSKYWQEAWEQKVEAIEVEVFKIQLFKRIEPRDDKGFFGASEFSVSKLAVIVSDLTIAMWIGLFTTAAMVRHKFPDVLYGMFIAIVCCALGVVIFYTARSGIRRHTE